MVTPTFVFSVVVVTVALLAFGTTQTYLRFSSSGPGCGAGACTHAGAGQGAGRPSGGAVADGTAHGSPISSASPSSGQARTHHAPLVWVGYRTVRTLPTGFVALLSITARGSAPVRLWRLSLSYPGVQIYAMAGATWQAGDNGTVTIEPLPQTPELRSGSTLPITFSANGQPGAPSGCRFNGVRCHVKYGG